ncbi:hypothetical protein Asp14428_03240 [Actinoplanes sp. NBRC 14428]|nr:hypothetical protein Asp14428_03240 [Actinoplanes sp. NBRC 14428]
MRLWYFNVRERSAVVEPTSLLTGAQYCARYAIPSSDDACRRKLVATGSNVKLTVPISGKVRRLGFPDLDLSCVDEATAEGTCKITESDFNTWATMNSPAPARITTEKGAIVEVAALLLL